MKIGEFKTESSTTTFYVIGWEQDEVFWLSQRPVKGKPGKYIKEFRRKAIFYKSSRYSSCEGNLQTEYYPSAARHWKTFKGASKALENIKSVDRTQRTSAAIVMRYSETGTRQSSLIPSYSE